MLDFLKKKRNLRLAILLVTAAGLLVLSYRLSAIVNPLIIALLIAYILNPLVNRIEGLRLPLFGRKVGLGRTGSVVVIYLTGLGLVAVLFVVVVPVVFSEIKYLSFALPGEKALEPEEVFDLATEGDELAGMEQVPVTEPFADRNRNGLRDPDEPYQDVNGNGRFDAGEPFEDTNGNGVCDPEEPFTDLDGDGRWDPPEPFEDLDGDGRHFPGETYHDLDGNGAFTPAEPFTDRNGNGRYDGPEPFTDLDGNGRWDEGEPFTDLDEDGRRDEGEPFEDENGDGSWTPHESMLFKDLNDNGRYDPPEPFEDVNGNGVHDRGEPFVDANGNGRRDAAETWADWNQNGVWDPEIRRPAFVALSSEPWTDGDGNGRWDEGEPFEDWNGNGRHDPYFFYMDADRDGSFDLGWADQAVYQLRSWIARWNARFPSQKVHITLDSARSELEKYFLGTDERYRSLTSFLLYAVKSGLMGFLDVISIFVLIPFYTFFFLRSMNGIRETIQRNLPGRYRPRLWRILLDIHESVSSFFRGRLAVCFLVAALTWLLLALFDVRFSLLLGLVAGVAIIVPLLSIFIVDVPVLIILLATGGSAWQMAGALTCLSLLQGFENFILSPKVLGEETQLHPITIFVSFLVGGSLFGLFGVLLAVPMASIAKILSREFILPQIQAFAKEKPLLPEGTETGLFERKEGEGGRLDSDSGREYDAPDA